MDSLTARYLAQELDARWRGARVRGSRFDQQARRVELAVGDDRVWIDLSSPEVVVRHAAGPIAGDLMRGWSVDRVYAPIDDRRLVIELVRPGRFKGSPSRRARLEVSAVPTARGAVLCDAGGRHLAAVGSRVPPPAEPRPELDESTVESAARSGDLPTLLGGRWMSPVVARWLMSDPSLAAERYRSILREAPARPVRCDGRLFPLPVCPDAEPAASLIEPAQAVSAPAAPVEDRLARARRRMEAELERAREAPRLRELADALAALGDVPAPATIPLADGTIAPVAARAG